MNIEINSADSSDVEAIFNLLYEMHEENGRYPFDAEKVEEVIRFTMQHGEVFIALSDGVVVGTVGLSVCEVWYSRAAHLGDTWLYLTPKHRTLQNFNALLTALLLSAEENGLPLQIDLNTIVDTERKEKLFSRHADQLLRAYEFRPVGGTFQMRI